MNENQRKESKLLSLKESIEHYVRPKMRLHLAGGIGGPGAAICEIIRQYVNTAPDFELIQSTVTGHAINLIHCGLIKKLVFSACMEITESAHPSKVIQEAHADSKVELDNWSLLSLQQRLMAGALGLSFLPTRSLMGSTLADDNSESFIELDDPFHHGERIGVVRAINPDLSIVHGCVSDVYGNTILPVPYGDDIWGSLASSGGVLVTVEKIVSTDVIRKYSSLVKIPASIVKTVSIAPMGLHPFSLTSPVSEMDVSYDADASFLGDMHEASSDTQRLNDWLNAWVIDRPTHNQYLKRLGEERISELKRTAREAPDNEPKQKERIACVSSQEYTREEMVLIAAARAIVDSVMESNYKTMLVGAGSWSIAAQLAYHELITKGYEIDLITGNGQIGYMPYPGASSAQTVTGIYSSKMLTDTIMTHGVFVGGENSSCLSILGAGQIDNYGNINSSRTSDGAFLVGTGGANDSANAKEVIVILYQSRKRFADKMPYITASGEKVKKIISTMGVFKKEFGKSELRLEACLPDSSTRSLEETINEIQNKCSWDLKHADTIDYLQEPSATELSILRSIMSQGKVTDSNDEV